MTVMDINLYALTLLYYPTGTQGVSFQKIHVPGSKQELSEVK